MLAGEQERAADLVAVNRLIRQSAEQSGDAAIADVLEDLERVLLEIANAPADATSNELTDLQSRITTEDLLFRVRVIASEMRQRTLNRSRGWRSSPGEEDADFITASVAERNAARRRGLQARGRVEENRR